ncbi:MAG TPA: XrtA/PEP-CTERM system TPR-repeat protein PrsT [Casimicrobiaceae bacterium]|nr:XrtA/PEP-CTERM system TPR-repeat protein PrsT [Casimicrobiaceae bacterium]
MKHDPHRPPSTAERNKRATVVAAALCLFTGIASSTPAHSTAIQTTPVPEFGAAFETRSAEAGRIAALIANHEFDKALALSDEMIKSAPNRSPGYNLQGTAYLGKRDVASARKSFEQALKVEPGNPIALVNLAHLDMQQKDADGARKRFQAVLSKDSRNIDAMLGMAQLDYQKGDAKAGFAWLEKAKAARPEAIDPRLNIAAFHMRRNNFAQAIMELNEGTRTHADHPELLNLLGLAQMGAGQNDTAVATFRRLVAARPDAPLSYFRLATAQIGAGAFAQASESLTRALKINPDYIDALVAQAGLEVRAKRYADALKIARQVQAIPSAASGGLVLEGDVLLAQEQHADAAKVYERAFAASPSGVVVTKLHTVLSRAGNTKDANAALERWMKDHPNDVTVLHYAAAEELRQGEPKAAMGRYQQILAREPQDVVAMNNLASLYQQAGDARALGLAETAYKLNPESPVVSDTLGWILVGQGKTARGMKLLESALAREPNNPEIRYHVAAARAKAGDKAVARRELEALLASGQPFSQREAAQALLKQL